MKQDEERLISEEEWAQGHRPFSKEEAEEFDEKFLRWFRKPSYTSSPQESGLLVEIYLPKLAEYQGALYDTLTDGFDKNKVEDHFRDKDQEKKQRIKNMLKRYHPSVASYEDNMITVLRGLFDGERPLFSGYSMYEVDGVFNSPENGIIAERAQVIRIIFKPYIGWFMKGGLNILKQQRNINQKDVEELQERIEERLMHLATLYFDSPPQDKASFLKRHNDDLDIIDKFIIYFLDLWVNCVLLFLFGYLAFNITEKFLELKEQDASKGEEEMWITTFWNLKVNRIPFNEGVESLMVMSESEDEPVDMNTV